MWQGLQAWYSPMLFVRSRLGQLGELLYGHYVRSAREHLFDKSVVNLGLTVSAGVGEDNNVIIEIEALADRGKDDTTGRDSAEDNRVDVMGSQDAAEACVGEHAKTNFRQNRIALLDVKLGMELRSIGSDD